MSSGVYQAKQIWLTNGMSGKRQNSCFWFCRFCELSGRKEGLILMAESKQRTRFSEKQGLYANNSIKQQTNSRQQYTGGEMPSMRKQGVMGRVGSSYCSTGQPVASVKSNMG